MDILNFLERLAHTPSQMMQFIIFNADDATQEPFIKNDSTIIKQKLSTRSYWADAEDVVQF